MRFANVNPLRWARTHADAESAALSGSRVITTLAVVGSMLIPIALSYFFMAQSLRLDEAQSLWQTSRSVGAVLAIVAGDVHVPLYHLVLHFWRLYIGDSVVYARALSLLFFVLSVPAIYFLGKRAYGERIGLLAMVLFAISPFMNWYGNEIRMYTMFVFFAIANQYLFLRIFKAQEHSDTVWALYVVTAVLGVYTHYFFFLNLFAQAVFFGLRYHRFPAYSFRRFLITASIVIISFAPWVWYVYHIGTVGFQEPALQLPSAVNLFSAFSQFLFGFQNDALNTVFLSLWPVAVILVLFTLGRNHRLTAETAYFLVIVAASFGLAFAVSFAITPIFVSRYMIFTIPAFYLVVASMSTTYTPRVRLFAQGTLLALMLLSLGIEVVNPRTPVKENYAAAVSYLNAHTTAQDSIVLSAPFTIYPVQYYYRGAATISTLPIWNQYKYGPIPDFDAKQLPSQVAQVTKNDQRVFLLLSYDQGYEKDIKKYFDSHYQMLYQQNYSNDLSLYVYRLRYNTPQSAISAAL